MSNIDELKNECEHLLALLNDPHPGLMTWQLAVGKRLENIREFWV